MTPLGRLITERITAGGPISLADYMADCLLHPVHGYYATRDPFGRAGDFITAPEISQMFGEVLGLALAQAWLDQGSPSRFVLAEPGPGRGTLMADILRAGGTVPGFAEAAEVHLIEASPHLRAVQKATLDGVSVIWHDRIGTLPCGPLYLVANEFLDALPIRQFVRGRDGWRERLVGLKDGRLAFGLSGEMQVSFLADRLGDTGAGEVVEVCPALPAIAEEIGRRVARQGGVALFIDYGGWRSCGDTFQAVSAHRPVDPLDRPGEADLTAHVDFEALARQLAATGATVTTAVRQGQFLERLGISARAKALAQRMTGAALDQHVAAHRRLTHPDEMGDLFKVIACHPQGSPPPPGLDAA
jgi:SAM-dependent MidA family methyltransferase